VYVDDVSLVPVSGRCGPDCTAKGATCPDAAAPPENTLCDTTTGACVACLSDTDCDDGDECTDDACVTGLCETVSSAPGTPCSTGVCDGATTAPACVECVGDEDCGAGEDCDEVTHACLTTDAGATDDAGAEADAGRDAGATPDAGRDAGGIDAGTPPVATGGCGCSVRGGRSLTGIVALWLLGMLAARRRR
jgi:MYXO-CTERM domain-containing protein